MSIIILKPTCATPVYEKAALVCKTMYEQVTGKILRYGMFAVSQNKLGNNDVFDASGNATQGVLFADITTAKNTVLELKIVGFTSENTDAKLAIGAFVKMTGEEGSEYAYLQDDTRGDKIGKYYFASYNDIAENV